MSQREDILALLHGDKPPQPPVFSGLIHITAEGLQSDGLVFHEIHHDAGKMAKAAASTHKLTGIPSAALPLDLCAPAEALGAALNFYESGEMQFPQVNRVAFESTKEIRELENREWERGRIGLICEAIRLVKEDVGTDVVISGLIPGPYTLLLYVCNTANLFTEMKKESQAVLDSLFHLSSFLAQIGEAYRNAGADFITIHDMGGSAGFIGPAKYEQFVYPAEKYLIEQLAKPCVLSVCGNMDRSLHLLARTGAEAVSVDQLTDLRAAREALKESLLFGNLDPVESLYRGDEAQVRESVSKAKEAGVDAVWPGCDLVPQTPTRNIATMLKD